MRLDFKRFYSFSVRTVLKKSKQLILGHEKLQVENRQNTYDFYIKPYQNIKVRY